MIYKVFQRPFDRYGEKPYQTKRLERKLRLDYKTKINKTEYTRTGQMVRIAHTKDRTKTD